MYQQGYVSVENCGQGEGSPGVLKFECPTSLYLVGMVIYSLLLTFSYWKEFFCIQRRGSRTGPWLQCFWKAEECAGRDQFLF